jgi:hypothetical protein
MEDLFHWRLQRLVLFDVGDVDDLIQSAHMPDPQIETLCARIGVDSALAPAALRSVAERGRLLVAASEHGTRALRLREHVLERLDELGL